MAVRLACRYGSDEGVAVDLDDVTYLLREVWRGFSARDADRVVAPGGDKGLMRATAHLTFTRWVGLAAGRRVGAAGRLARECTQISRSALVGRAVQGSSVAANQLPWGEGSAVKSCGARCRAPYSCACEL